MAGKITGNIKSKRSEASNRVAKFENMKLIYIEEEKDEKPKGKDFIVSHNGGGGSE